MQQQIDHEKEQLVREFMAAIAPSSLEAAAILERAEEMAEIYIGWRQIEREGLR